MCTRLGNARFGNQCKLAICTYAAKISGESQHFGHFCPRQGLLRHIGSNFVKVTVTNFQCKTLDVFEMFWVCLKQFYFEILCNYTPCDFHLALTVTCSQEPGLRLPVLIWSYRELSLPIRGQILKSEIGDAFKDNPEIWYHTWLDIHWKQEKHFKDEILLKNCKILTTIGTYVWRHTYLAVKIIFVKV